MNVFFQTLCHCCHSCGWQGGRRLDGQIVVRHGVVDRVSVLTDGDLLGSVTGRLVDVLKDTATL